MTIKPEPDHGQKFDDWFPHFRDLVELFVRDMLIETPQPAVPVGGESAAPQDGGSTPPDGGLGLRDAWGEGYAVMDRHRLFESNVLLMAPEHPPHDMSLQVAGSYGGARRDKWEAKHIRGGGYVPSVEVQRALLGTPWMSEKGCQLSIPPIYTEHIGAQLLTHLEAEDVA